MHNFKVLYFAYKEGLGIPVERNNIAFAVRHKTIFANEAQNPMERLDAFKKFYETMSICPISKQLMTVPEMGFNGYCYQQGFTPKCSDPESEYIFIPNEERINKTLKKAVGEMKLKSLLTESDYVTFYRSLAEDVITLSASVDPVLENGIVRSERLIIESVARGRDIQGNGARWEVTSPSLHCIRYIRLQQALYNLKRDLDPKDPLNTDILLELQLCQWPEEQNEIVIRRVDLLHRQLHHRLKTTDELANLIERDPVLKRQVIKYDINPIVRVVAESAIESPLCASFWGALYLLILAFLALDAGFVYLFVPVDWLFSDREGPHDLSLIEREYGISSNDHASTKKLKIMYAIVYVFCAGISAMMLMATGLSHAIGSVLLADIGFFDSKQREIYCCFNHSIVIASTISSSVLSLLWKIASPIGRERNVSAQYHLV